MSYLHHKVKPAQRVISLRRSAPESVTKREHLHRDMYNAKYTQLNQELERLMIKSKVKLPAFSDISSILLRSKRYASRNEYNKALQQLTLAIAAMLALCSPAESQFNSAKGGLGPDLGVCSNPEVLLKWHMIPSVNKPKSISRSAKRVEAKTKKSEKKISSTNTTRKGTKKSKKKKQTQKRRK